MARLLLASGACRFLVVLLVWGACPHGVLAAQDGESRPPLLPATQAWEVQLPSRPAAGGAIDAARVYVPLEDGTLVALERASGTRAWTASSVGHSTPAVHDASVYVARDGALVALESATGRERWAASIDARAAAPPPVAAGGRIVVVTASGLAAVRVEDGQPIWTAPLPGPAAPATLTAAADSVFVVRGGLVTAVEISRGAVRWRRELPVLAGTPAVVGDRLLVGSADALLALEIDTGDLAWRWRLGGAVVGAAGGDGMLYVASLDALLRGLRLGSGNQVWKRELVFRPVAPPLLRDGLILQPGNEVLAAFDIGTGSPVATHDDDGTLLGAPLVAPGEGDVGIVLVYRDGRVVGLAATREDAGEKQ